MSNTGGFVYGLVKLVNFGLLFEFEKYRTNLLIKLVIVLEYCVTIDLILESCS